MKNGATPSQLMGKRIRCGAVAFVWIAWSVMMCRDELTRRGFPAARPVQLLNVGTNNGIPLLGDGFLGRTLFIK